MTPEIMEENHHIVCSRKENTTDQNLSTGISITITFFFFFEIMLFILDFKYSHGDIFQTLVNQLFNQKTPTYTSYYQ